MKTVLAIAILTVVLAVAAMAQSTPPGPGPATPALPPVPAAEATRFQELVIQNQSIIMSKEYQAWVNSPGPARLNEIQRLWNEAEAATLASLKLSPKTHAIQVTQDGKVSVILKPVADAPAAEPAAKDVPATKPKEAAKK